jgi:hypothetical protein
MSLRLCVRSEARRLGTIARRDKRCAFRGPFQAAFQTTNVDQRPFAMGLDAEGHTFFVALRTGTIRKRRIRHGTRNSTKQWDGRLYREPLIAVFFKRGSMGRVARGKVSEASIRA